MGEIADDMIDGQCCSHCMTYFATAHGYPVLCVECFNEGKKRGSYDEKSKTVDELQCATEEALS